MVCLELFEFRLSDLQLTLMQRSTEVNAMAM